MDNIFIFIPDKTMSPVVKRYSARMGVLGWTGREMLVLSDERNLQGNMDKLVALKVNFTMADILGINLGASLQIKQRLKSDGIQVFTVDTRGLPWSTMEEASEEVMMNRWRVGSSVFHDDVAIEIIRMVEESQESYELQVHKTKIRNNYKLISKTNKNPLQEGLGEFVDASSQMEDDVFSLV